MSRSDFVSALAPDQELVNRSGSDPLKVNCFNVVVLS